MKRTLITLLLVSLAFTSEDVTACGKTPVDAKKEVRKSTATDVRKLAHRTTGRTSAKKEELHPDFLIGNSVFRF